MGKAKKMKKDEIRLEENEKKLLKDQYREDENNLIQIIRERKKIKIEMTWEEDEY